MITKTNLRREISDQLSYIDAKMYIEYDTLLDGLTDDIWRNPELFLTSESFWELMKEYEI